VTANVYCKAIELGRACYRLFAVVPKPKMEAAAGGSDFDRCVTAAADNLAGYTFVAVNIYDGQVGDRPGDRSDVGTWVAVRPSLDLAPGRPACAWCIEIGPFEQGSLATGRGWQRSQPDIIILAGGGSENCAAERLG
jgi:hypothetical protein